MLSYSVMRNSFMIHSYRHRLQTRAGAIPDTQYFQGCALGQCALNRD